MGTLKYLFLSFRPKQWAKNTLLFMALLFSIDLYWDPSNLHLLGNLLGRVALAFALFCLLSSSIYLLNDLLDLESDRRHPEKRRRPLASGALRPPYAIACLFLLVAVALPLSFLLHPGFGLVAVGYLALEITYTFLLKHLIILDVFAVATGFLLRAVAGAVVIEVPISPWLYLCTALGALFIAITKRRQELLVMKENASSHRATLGHYTMPLLDEMTALVAASTIIAYSLYTFTAPNLPPNHAMMLTIPFVLYGILRYLYLVQARNLGEAPEEALFRDKPLLITVLLWAAAATAILIFYRG